MNIPFERIQTINFEQSLFHQFFNVVKLEIDTAGSKGSEFSFAALDQEVAASLRDLILTEKSKTQLDPEGRNSEMSIESDQPAEVTVMKLSLNELIKVGLGQNHFRSFFLIVIFFSWSFDQLREIGFSPDQMMDELNRDAVEYGKIAFIVLALLAVMISLIISLSRTILRYYDFRLIRSKDGFKVISGLLNRRQVSAKDHKIQIVSWADNPLKRMMNMFDVYLKQASSVQVQNKKSIVIPGCNAENLSQLKNYYFKSYEWENLTEFGISKKFIARRMLYLGLIPFVFLFSGSYFLLGPGFAIATIIWLPLIYFANLVAFKKWKISLNEHILYVRHGLFGNYYKSLRIYKIQNISISQSIYQRRNDLADVIIYTASGRLSLPYLPLNTANQLVDYIAFRIETDIRHWM